MRLTRASALAVGLAAVAVTVTAALAGCSSGAWFQPSTPAVSLAADSSCPPSLGSARDVVYRAGGPMGLVLDAAPKSALVCFYERPPTDGSHDGTRELARQIRLSSARAVA